MKELIHILAEEAGLYSDGTPDAWDQEAIERFAALVAAHEREACEAAAYDNRIGCDCPCAAVIRARGEKP
jgi:hypothetical protein